MTIIFFACFLWVCRNVEWLQHSESVTIQVQPYKWKIRNNWKRVVCCPVTHWKGQFSVIIHSCQWKLAKSLSICEGHWTTYFTKRNEVYKMARKCMEGHQKRIWDFEVNVKILQKHIFFGIWMISQIGWQHCLFYMKFILDHVMEDMNSRYNPFFSVLEDEHAKVE